MITLKVTDNEMTVECDGVKDFKDITNNENLKKIKDFASIYHNEVVKSRVDLETESAKRFSEIDAARTAAANEHDINLTRINEAVEIRANRRYVISDIVRKTGSAIGISGAIIGALKLARVVLGTPSISVESYEVDHPEEKKLTVDDKTSEKKKK